MPTTTSIEEKQKELDALQTAFDEYVVSSRELEEELDAELTQCQNDLAKAEAYNTALATQLSNIQPQLNSLESKVAQLTTQLTSESQKRIAAEMKMEEYENKLRESEGTIYALRSSEMRKLKQENEELCERLAYVEGEAEDYRNELNTERERHRIELEEAQSDVSMLRSMLKKREEELETLETTDIGNVIVVGGDEEDDEKRGEDEKEKMDEEEMVVIDEAVDGQKTMIPTTTTTAATTTITTPSISTDTMTPTKDEREEYIRTLEDELELVTEQLIEAETKLSRSQADLEDALALVEEQQQQHNDSEADMRNHLEGEIKRLQTMLLSSNENKSSGANTFEEEKSSMEDLIGMEDTNIDDILQSKDSEVIAKEVRTMAKQIAVQKSHNAELLTKILKLQGNIQVCCRIRPMSIDESQQGLHEVAQSLSETDVACFDERTKMWKSYAFDKVWGPESKQKDVFQDVEPMILSVIDGYNACIFAYGQSE